MAQETVRLRLEAENGLATQEYRVDDGKVEVRNLYPYSAYAPPESRWQRLTAQQLSVHVERNTVVAQWLERRLGWRRLLQACVGQEPYQWRAAENGVEMDRNAA
jgi:hypothetical protein